MHAIDNKAAQAGQAELSITQQTEHLLIISIGPVQDFIAAARKCQDLWFGSFLLSELSARLALGLQKQDAELIFPGSKLKESDKVSVANKIVAKLPSGLKPEVAVAAARKEMNGWLHKLRDKSFGRCEDVLCRLPLPKGKTTRFYREIANKQVDDLIELQWAAVPMIGSYSDVHADAERLLAWRKNTRDFGSVPWDAANVPKSSTDGQRESVIEDGLFDEMKKNPSLDVYPLGKNERLCGVGVLKRFGVEVIEDENFGGTQIRRPVFHSNSHVAAGPLFKRLERVGDKGQDALNKYIQCLEVLHVRVEHFKVRSRKSSRPIYDGSLLYPDRLPSIFDEDSTVKREEQPQAVGKAQDALKDFFAALGWSQSEPYYVMLAADGDHMGAAIQELAQRPDNGVAKHQALSEKLAEFAKKARTIIDDDHAGSLIYSGGDDVLALLPLHTALDCARALKIEFDKVGSGLLEKKPTLSVGLAVVHHLEHMGRARKLAHDAEKLAKKKRNSLAIIVDKRSGGTLSITGSWDEKSASIDKRIQNWVTLLEEEKLPDGVAFELLEVLAPFEVPSPGADPNQKPVPPSAELKSLVQRVLGRKRSGGGQSVLHEDIIKELTARFEADSDPIAAVRALSYELQIAREFLRAKQLAEGGIAQ